MELQLVQGIELRHPCLPCHMLAKIRISLDALQEFVAEQLSGIFRAYGHDVGLHVQFLANSNKAQSEDYKADPLWDQFQVRAILDIYHCSLLESPQHID